MKLWLFKSEPRVWSWNDQAARGAAGEPWDGVRNYQARNFMRTMAMGDRGFFYHSQTERAVVGIVEVARTSHPDPSTDDERWDCVTIRAVAPMQRAVSLDAIRADGNLTDMVLVRNSRLSVQPVAETEWNAVCRMGGADSYTV